MRIGGKSADNHVNGRKHRRQFISGYQHHDETELDVSDSDSSGFAMHRFMYAGYARRCSSGGNTGGARSTALQSSSQGLGNGYSNGGSRNLDAAAISGDDGRAGPPHL